MVGKITVFATDRHLATRRVGTCRSARAPSFTGHHPSNSLRIARLPSVRFMKIGKCFSELKSYIIAYACMLGCLVVVVVVVCFLVGSQRSVVG